MSHQHASQQLVHELLRIAHHAAQLVLQHYQHPAQVQFKAPGNPVTPADLAANEYISEQLALSFAGTPVVAEESAPGDYADFAAASRVFFVDPLDGTQEFIARNGEFVVMIGVLDQAIASAGVVVAPARQQSWFGALGWGCFTGQAHAATRVYPTSTRNLSEAVAVASRSHQSPALQRALSRVGASRIEALGSAGLKGVAVASGAADLYLAPYSAGSRWDACAVDALVCAAGGCFSDARGQRLDYRAAELSNTHGLLATNAWLHNAVLERLATAQD